MFAGISRFSLLIIASLMAFSAFVLGGCVTTQSAGPMPEAKKENITALKDHGQKNLETGNYDTAVKAYSNVLGLDDQDHEARAGLAESYLKQNKPEKALEQYQVLMSVPEYQALALQGVGLSEFKKNNMAAAQETLEQATAADETLWRAWNALAQIYDYEADWKKAENAYNMALTHTDDKYVIYNNMGVSYMAQERFEDAEQAFSEAVRFKPDLEIAKTNYKLALALQKKYDDATIESDAEERAKALNNAGYAALLQGQYDKAEKMLLKAIEVNPSFYKAAYKNLQVLHQLKHKKKS